MRAKPKSVIFTRSGIERAQVLEMFLQRNATHELHDQKRKAAGFGDGVDRDDVFVVDRGRRPRLARKPLPGAGLRRKLRREHFDGDQTVERRVAGLQHDSHPALPDDRQDFVGSESSQPARSIGCVQIRKQLVMCAEL
jgi:hypothetical protein